MIRLFYAVLCLQEPNLWTDTPIRDGSRTYSRYSYISTMQSAPINPISPISPISPIRPISLISPIFPISHHHLSITVQPYEQCVHSQVSHQQDKESEAHVESVVSVVSKERQGAAMERDGINYQGDECPRLFRVPTPKVAPRLACPYSTEEDADGKQHGGYEHDVALRTDYSHGVQHIGGDDYAYVDDKIRGAEYGIVNWETDLMPLWQDAVVGRCGKEPAYQ